MCESIHGEKAEASHCLLSDERWAQQIMFLQPWEEVGTLGDLKER